MSDVYLDHAATTPMRPAAVEAMLPFLSDVYGNPSGAHSAARRARRALDDARDQLADAVGAHPSEIVFTSGGTEADNLAVRGVGDAVGGTVLCSAVEHHAVLEPVRAASGEVVPVDDRGRVDVDALRGRLAVSDRAAVGLVSVMLANNETGAVNDLGRVAEALRDVTNEVRLHTDAVAAAAWLDLREAARDADVVTLSAHKLGGPKGIGALVVRSGVPIQPTVLGGGQEQERRSGTPNVAGAVGFAAALAEVAAQRAETNSRVEGLRSKLVAGMGSIDGLVVLSPEGAGERTPGTVQVGVRGVSREALVFLLDQAGVAASWGSSCASGATETSHVLAAMGVDNALADGALRLSLGWSSTESDVDRVLAVLPGIVAQLRSEAA